MEHEKACEFITNRVKNELPKVLKYHSYAHTMDVLRAAMNLANLEGISEY